MSAIKGLGLVCALFLANNSFARDLTSGEIANTQHFEVVSDTLNCRTAPGTSFPVAFSFIRGDLVIAVDYENYEVQPDAAGNLWIRTFTTFRTDSSAELTNCWVRAKSEYLESFSDFGLIARCKTAKHRVEIFSNKVTSTDPNAYMLTYYAYQLPYIAGAVPSLTLQRFVDDNHPLPHVTHTRILRFWNGEFGYSLETTHPYTTNDPASAHSETHLYVGKGSNDEMDTTLSDNICLPFAD